MKTDRVLQLAFERAFQTRLPARRVKWAREHEPCKGCLRAKNRARTNAAKRGQKWSRAAKTGQTRTEIFLA